MADMTDLGFDANNVEPNKAFDLIPDGWYEAMIVESERKSTKAQTGEYIALTFALLAEPFKSQNRKLWDNLNVKNPNDKAVQIARGQLSAICRAVNVLVPRDTSELHNLPLLVKVGTEVGGDGVVRNKIKGYKPRDGAVAAAPATATSTSPAPSGQAHQPSNAGATPPWAKKATG
jgi:hypothetical protein